MTRLLVPHGEALRRNNFDAIRLGMALLVVWSHSFALGRGSEATEPVSVLLGGTYNSGNIGVLAFFTISGFLITLSWLRARSWHDYLKRRVLRIHPGYLVAVTLCALVVVPAFSSRPFGMLRGDEALGLVSNLWLRNFIPQSDAFGGGPVNGSLWSIAFEFWCYLGVLALGLAGLIRRRWLYPAVAVAVMAVRVWLDMTGRKPGAGLIAHIIGFPYLWFVVLPSFMLGGTLLLYRERLPRSGALLLGLVALTIAAGHLPIADPLRLCIARLLLPPTLAYAILYLAFAPGARWRHAARYGDFSYGTYLYAFPIQQMLGATVRNVVAFPVFILLSLTLSLAAGVASWLLVERWFLPRARHGTGPRPSRRPLEEEATIVAP